jgi:chromosome segregation ATPase
MRKPKADIHKKAQGKRMKNMYRKAKNYDDLKPIYTRVSNELTDLKRVNAKMDEQMKKLINMEAEARIQKKEMQEANNKLFRKNQSLDHELKIAKALCETQTKSVRRLNEELDRERQLTARYESKITRINKTIELFSQVAREEGR